MSCKKCQCGATPLWRVVRGTKRGRRREVVRERLQCPSCGNQTAAMKSRQLLTAEWESAGWCGQAEVSGLEVAVGSGSRQSEGGAQ
jgi:hypothetical protein